MTHPRQTIRESIAERLREKFNNVFITRAKALFEQDLPAVLVYTNSETIKEERWDTDGFGALFRELELCIEAVDTGKDDLENKLDNTAETIEYLLNGWEIPNRKSASGAAAGGIGVHGGAEAVAPVVRGHGGKIPVHGDPA